MGRRFCHTPSDNAKPCGMLYQNLCDSSSQKYRERYKEISRYPTEEEIIRSYQYAKDLGLNYETLSFEKLVFGLSL
jgi:hypothetical protein